MDWSLKTAGEHSIGGIHLQTTSSTSRILAIGYFNRSAASQIVCLLHVAQVFFSTIRCSDLSDIE